MNPRVVGREGSLPACLPACGVAYPTEINCCMLKGETRNETGAEKSFHSYSKIISNK